MVTTDYEADCRTVWPDDCGIEEYEQTRIVECVTHNDVVADVSHCEGMDMPTTSRTCPAQPACSN